MTERIQFPRNINYGLAFNAVLEHKKSYQAKSTVQLDGITGRGKYARVDKVSFTVTERTNSATNTKTYIVEQV